MASFWGHVPILSRSSPGGGHLTPGSTSKRTVLRPQVVLGSRSQRCTVRTNTGTVQHLGRNAVHMAAAPSLSHHIRISTHGMAW